MVFTEDKLHSNIFALVLTIHWIFTRPYELADISHALFFQPLLELFWDPLSLVSRDFRVRFLICF